MYQATVVGSLPIFKSRLIDRLTCLADEFNVEEFVLPVGLLLLIDQENGGDATADELAKRFHILDFESRNVIDFYFLGWRFQDYSSSNKKPGFDLYAFQAFRNALRQAGVVEFGGNADLLLVDACYNSNDFQLDFSRAIHVDLSASKQKEDFPTLGRFLQSLVEAAEQVREARDIGIEGSPTIFISDSLGLAIAKKSILDFILEKWGKIFGAKQMASVATKNLGPSVSIRHL